MIAKIAILILAGILLPHLYIDLHYHYRKPLWKRLLWWLPSLLLMVATVYFSLLPGFITDDPTALFAYLLALGLITLPTAVYALCSSVGLVVCRLRHKHANWGNLLGWLLALAVVYIVLYGTFVGPTKLKVREVELSYSDLPREFNGYRIVLFSDVHAGTFNTCYPTRLKETIDTINAQHANLIAFVGDLQNVQPTELYPIQHVLSSLKARDGVFSVLGNHDYSFYLDADPVVKAANEREMVSRQRQFGWTVLLNENHSVERGKSRIVIAGEENDGEGRFPAKGNLDKALEGTDSTDFVIMLQHDPSAWRRSILPLSNTQLTLSGHTHGGQLSLFGLRPTQIVNTEDYGLYQSNGQRLLVTSGVGALLPFRFGVPPEIVVLTLKCAQK